MAESLAKTNRLIVVEEGTRQGGVGAEISATMLEMAFDDLDAPIERVAGADVPIPASATLESAAVPNADDICTAVRKSLR